MHALFVALWCLVPGPCSMRVNLNDLLVFSGVAGVRDAAGGSGACFGPFLGASIHRFFEKARSSETRVCFLRMSSCF